MTRLFDRHHCCCCCSTVPQLATLRPSCEDEHRGAKYLILLPQPASGNFSQGSRSFFFGGWKVESDCGTEYCGDWGYSCWYGLRIRGTVLAELGPDCGFSAMG
jgi:hypothetical protein